MKFNQIKALLLKRTNYTTSTCTLEDGETIAAFANIEDAATMLTTKNPIDYFIYIVSPEETDRLLEREFPLYTETTKIIQMAGSVEDAREIFRELLGESIDYNLYININDMYYDDEEEDFDLFN